MKLTAALLERLVMRWRETRDVYASQVRVGEKLLEAMRPLGPDATVGEVFNSLPEEDRSVLARVRGVSLAGDEEDAELSED